MQSTESTSKTSSLLGDVLRLTPDKILPARDRRAVERLKSGAPVLVLLAAGKGTRFGRDPKCVQLVGGVPLARHSILAFRRQAGTAAPVIAIVGYRHGEVAAAIGDDTLHVLSDDPAGGTAWAAREAFCVPDLAESDALVVVGMGDRIVPASIFGRLLECHGPGAGEADLTFLTAQYEPPRNRGKGRVLRDESGRVLRLIEERDIAAEKDELTRQALSNLTEGNCPLYVIRAGRLKRLLARVGNRNAQGQYYLTDIVAMLSREGGEIRTVTVTPADPEYDLLCADVTRPEDLSILEELLAGRNGLLARGLDETDAAVQLLLEGRSRVQVLAIARQLEQLRDQVRQERLGYRDDEPVAIGVAGGRLRLAFMHPDMARFHGPAWQMPIGAGDPAGTEQIVMLIQSATDGRLHLTPLDPRYREHINDLPADSESMYPGVDIADLRSYEQFGTRMSENLLLSLGYFSDAELAERRKRGQPLPPQALWAGNGMRRPFALVGNVLASLRTLRGGHLGRRVQAALGREHFGGLHMVCTGGIPMGGFSSSSALTVALKNALNALFALGIPADLLVYLACQAEYGTGVRAGALDQATEQKGRLGQGALISSDPRDRYGILRTYPVPCERFKILFPYSVPRDREAWRWSWGGFSGDPSEARLTAGELRKLTGKAAEMAALLTKLPLETTFFKQIEGDLLERGYLSVERRRWVAKTLLQVPLLIGREELRQRLLDRHSWYAVQVREATGMDARAAQWQATHDIEALFEGWREPRLRRSDEQEQVREEQGVPLRAMLAYLFGEVAKNFRLVNHPDEWIDWVRASQRGDCCVDIDPARLPGPDELRGGLAWERSTRGPDRLNLWLERCGARPFDYNRGLSDADLKGENPPDFARLAGSNFFRGLPLIDLAEAMLLRAFGPQAVAVRVNAAGQGDYFQVHVDRQIADVETVKSFLRQAFYARFALRPEPEFVEIDSGGGAAGVRLARFDLLDDLISRLHREAMRR